jgi:Peptidase propeptide and YPEB domain
MDATLSSIHPNPRCRRTHHISRSGRRTDVGEDRPVTSKELARVTAALEKRGYKNVHDVEVDDGRFEADATAPAGYEVELELDMRSLKIVREHRN